MAKVERAVSKSERAVMMAVSREWIVGVVVRRIARRFMAWLALVADNTEVVEMAGDDRGELVRVLVEDVRDLV